MIIFVILILDQMNAPVKNILNSQFSFFQILNLEKLIEVQNAKFNAAIEDLTSKLKQESEKRQALQSEIEKLAHCVTQV